MLSAMFCAVPRSVWRGTNVTALWSTSPEGATVTQNIPSLCLFALG